MEKPKGRNSVASSPFVPYAPGTRDFDYDAADDLRTITKHHAIASDGKRMGRVKKHHRKMTKALKSTGRVLGGKY